MSAAMLLRDGPHAGVLTLRLNRPERLNALTLGLARELLAAVPAASQDPAVRVIVLRGEGRAFCAGKDRDDPATGEFVEALQNLAAALMACPKPVVAAVHGWAVGAGLELLLNCDVVVASADAQFMLPEVTVGLFATGGALALLPRKIGLAKAKGALLLGQPFGAAEADNWGLLWAVEPTAGALEARVSAIAGQLAAADSRILAEAKRGLHQEAVGDFAAVLAREAQIHRRLSPLSAPPANPSRLDEVL
ncbi:enoyl-CoA hydratase/isomerase family protein [Caenimonas sedimenti]|uniref:Enoyl-CoA hydratase/isomerase family protein n=1 Tax=Caenimonas sedimenti TaxID=2596921 RepID=A0A562ZQJ1_9BURK|nr:enoyl-CoA hydratase/isomerase family protein [Caenimonas sedimenti]TWO70859.1 enoyl-CoA hydratase/isomerase family protein [Caenimonas sedimenti]